MEENDFYRKKNIEFCSKMKYLIKELDKYKKEIEQSKSKNE